MQLNQVPLQVAEPSNAVTNAVNAMPEEPTPQPFAQAIANIPAPVVWLVAMGIGLWLLSGPTRRRT